MRQAIPETPPEYDRTRITERPDGFYWQARDDGREYGPFATLLEAVQDMEANGEGAIEAGETVEEAERELGMTGWVDPETGEPAEDTVTRIEEH